MGARPACRCHAGEMSSLVPSPGVPSASGEQPAAGSMETSKTGAPSAEVPQSVRDAIRATTEDRATFTLACRFSGEDVSLTGADLSVAEGGLEQCLGASLLGFTGSARPKAWDAPMLRIELRARATVHWGIDAWQFATDTTTRDTGLGIHVADRPTRNRSSWPQSRRVASTSRRQTAPTWRRDAVDA